MEKEVIELFRRYFKDDPVSVEALPISGSPRVYYRLSGNDGTSVIGCTSYNIEENKTFIRLSQIFKSNGLAVPEILIVNAENTSYLQSDEGKVQLFDLISSSPLDADGCACLDEKIYSLVRKSIDELICFHILPDSQWKDAVQFEPFGKTLIECDFNYFRDKMLIPSCVNYNEDLLRSDLEKLRQKLLQIPERLQGLMYRDFQSRNVMVGENLVFIDYQSARRGPVLYDLASFLWQAKARFCSKLRSEMVEYYISEFEKKRRVDTSSAVHEFLPHFVLFRNLQVLGAYGFRGLVEGKKHFIESIRPATVNLRELLSGEVMGFYPELEQISQKLVTRFA